MKLMNKSTSIDFLGIENNSNVLLIYPHPDDETYCNAGLIQKLVRKGINLSVLCLTRGSKSTLVFSLKQGEELADVRKDEFEQVMRFLGVINYEILSLEDSKLIFEKQEVYKIINEQIDALKPDYVITYEPFGLYGHPDHILVSEIVTDLAKKLSFILIYSTVDQNYKHSKSSLKMANDPLGIKAIEPNFQLKLTPGEYIKKLMALKLYKSQISLKKDFFHGIYKALKMLNEYYFVSK